MLEFLDETKKMIYFKKECIVGFINGPNNCIMIVTTGKKEKYVKLSGTTLENKNIYDGLISVRDLKEYEI